MSSRLLAVLTLSIIFVRLHMSKRFAFHGVLETPKPSPELQNRKTLRLHEPIKYILRP